MGQSFAAITLCGEDRVWIDAEGGIHVLDRSHGGAFQDVHKLACGRAVPPEAWNWMRRQCGSEPDRDGGTNPGWQFVEYAKHMLGWARVTVNVWTCSTEIALEFDDDAISERAVKAIIALMHFVEKTAVSAVIVTDDFGHSGEEIKRAFREYRALLGAARNGEHRRRLDFAETPERPALGAWPALAPTRH
ncbi:MAG: hypothetical protein WCO00_10900 [Rhodospirillaceae bacterium]